MLLRAGGGGTAGGADYAAKRTPGWGPHGAQAAREGSGGEAMDVHGNSGAVVGMFKEVGCLSPTFGLILLYCTSRLAKIWTRPCCSSSHSTSRAVCAC